MLFASFFCIYKLLCLFFLELLYRETFAKVLCPEAVYNLVDCHIRECLKCEIRMRIYKN